MRGRRSNSYAKKTRSCGGESSNWSSRETTGGSRNGAPGERETEATTGTSSAGEQTTSRSVFSGHAETESENAGTQVRFRLRPAAQQSHSPKRRRSDRRPPSRAVYVRWSPESREDRGAIPTGNRAPDVLATLRCSGLSLSEVPQTGARARSAADLRCSGSSGRAIRTRRVGAGREDE